MIRVVAAVLVSLALTGPGFALSCVQPDVRATYADAEASTDDYILAVGRLTPLPGQRRPPVPDNPNAREDYTLLTRFEGHLASRAGFDRAVQVEVRLEVGCAGPWCGSLPTGRTLMFLLRRAQDLVLFEGPCPWLSFDATPEVLSDALSCLTGGGCTAF